MDLVLCKIVVFYKELDLNFSLPGPLYLLKSRYCRNMFLSCSPALTQYIDFQREGYSLGRSNTWQHMLHPCPPSLYSLIIWGPWSPGPSPCLMSLCNMIDQPMITIAGVGVTYDTQSPPTSCSLTHCPSQSLLRGVIDSSKGFHKLNSPCRSVMISLSEEPCMTKCWNASRALVSFTISLFSSSLQSVFTEPSDPEILIHLPWSKGLMMNVSWGNNDLNVLLAVWSGWILAMVGIWNSKS